MKSTIRLGGASAFWGDSMLAAPQLLASKNIDYLVFDYLAEITMSILARQRARDPKMGYAHDFVTATMKACLKDIAAQGVKVISNAGGVNPRACAEAIEALIAAQGLSLKVAYVTGDDLLAREAEIRQSAPKEMFTGEILPERLASMNAYLGARAIAQALAQGADIVITGRVVDSAVTLGPCLYEFGWADTDYDLLAAGSLAGHIIECGAQACGGVYTDYQDSEDWANIGYPICTIGKDGVFEITKPAGTGGCVTFGTIAEQLVYEIGDPQAYLLPDVTCDFSGVRIEEVGPNRVRVSGAKGTPPSGHYKVCATYEDGFRVGYYITIGGIDARIKAERTGHAVLKRMERMLRDANMAPLTESSVEIVGTEASYGPHARPGALASREVILKLAAKHPEERALNMLVREAASGATSFAQGFTGLGGNRPKVSPVVRLFSFLMPKSAVEVTCHSGPNATPVAIRTAGGFTPSAIKRPDGLASAHVTGGVHVPLIKLAYGRSGDKGNASNIGIIARKPDYMPYIRATLSARAVATYLGHLFDAGEGVCERFELPGVPALNFLLPQSLGGGGIASLRNDPQGKAHAQILLEFPVPVPPELAQML
ncbi:MAG TPA: terpene utilization protein AtuA [Alphaproteobacteria bacterium]|nr:terpene utilization protein AtuA [Alphaproteobacteria bacterium]HAJ47902.1 terpene utilization protein AtuA [Alphaproteobacteria bacterium]